jgi:pimeloyl-ACP methyl ester carboxylesterase
MKVKRLLIMMLLIVLVLAPITPSTHGETLIRPTMASRSTITDSSQAQVTEALHSSPVMFIENVGQFADGARFQVRGGDKTIWLAEDGLWVTVAEPPAQPSPASEGAPHPASRPPDGRRPASLAVAEPGESSEVRSVNIRLSFSGANPHPRLEPFNRLETVVSYFIGNDPAQWRAAVPVWGGVRYRDLYPGIDLEITGEGGHLVQRLVTRPGANLSAVRLRVEGADAVTPTPSPAAVASPNLVGRAGWEQGLLLRTALGDFTLPLLQVEEGIVKPALVQQVDRLAFEVAHPFTAGNETGSAPLSMTHPQQTVSLLYAGFLGGSGWDEGRGIAVDAAGNAYVTGFTWSRNFPAVVGPDTSYNGGDYDAFVAKVNPSGTGLVYAGFLGGSDIDEGNSIAVDADGNAYVTGGTISRNFPAVVGPDTSHNGDYDAFVAKVNPSGTGLVYAGFLGGSDIDWGNSIAVDADGNAYVTGRTDSRNFPAVVGPDTSYNGSRDAFVAKVNPSGTGLVYAGFLGGSNWDVGSDIAVDADGNAYVTGRTDSRNFPAVVGPDTSYNGGDYDAFVAKVNRSGTALLYAGFLGGSDIDWGNSIAVDADGNAYVTGGTLSSDFPAVVGPDTSYNVGNHDAFVAKVNPSGTGLVYAGFLGGSNWDVGSDIAVDADGNAYVTGGTLSSDFPAVVGPDTSYNGSRDAFVAKVNRSGTALLYAGFLGGSDRDWGSSIAVDAAGNAYVTGYTGSRNFPTRAGPDTSYNGGDYDAFVVKVGAGGGGEMEPPQPPSNLRSTDSNAGAVTLAWNDNSDNETGFYLYRWDGSVWVRIATLGANVTTYTDTDTNCGQSRYRVSAYNIAGESAMSNEVAVAIRCPQPPSNLRSTDSKAGAVTLAWNDNSDNETGFYLYRWDNSVWVRIATLGANVTTYTDTDPNCGQSRYRVSAYNIAGESAMSNEVAVAIRCPLILIPGIMGSYIYRKGWPRNQLWPGIGDPFRDDALRNLGPEEVSVRDAIRTYVFLTTKTRIYSPLIDFLKGEGYIEYPPIDNEQVPSETPLERCQQAKQDGQKPTLFVFAYDWRQSNRVSAQNLKEYIKCVRSIHNDSRVDIIAHSMGGLVARRYLIDNPSSHHVARLITIATPFYGAARAITVITTGKFPGVSDFSPIPKIYEGELKYVAETAAGAHELLPSPAYGKQYPCFLRISDPWGQERCASDKSYDVFEVWSKYFASGSTLRARQFHEGAQDDWTGDADLLRPMPAYYHFVGYRDRDDTLSEVSHSISCFIGFIVCRGIITDKSFDQGDGTVPIKSAEHQGYRHPRAKIIRVYGDHNEILAKAELHTELRNILQGTFAQSADLSNTADLPVAEAYYLRAINVASLTITDSTGELPSTATFYQLDEGVYAAVLPTDGVYTATITLKPQEGAIIEMRNGTNDSTNRAVRYLDLPPSGNNQVQVVFSQTGFSYLKRDTDADGLFETEVPPSADVSGSGANDREAPTINVSASGPLNARTVTITATDASGVKQIFYSLDRTTFQPYTGPLVVDATQTQFIYTFADDRIANRSGLLTYPLAWKIYLPLTIR